MTRRVLIKPSPPPHGGVFCNLGLSTGLADEGFQGRGGAATPGGAAESGDCPSGRETAGVPPALLLLDLPRPAWEPLVPAVTPRSGLEQPHVPQHHRSHSPECCGALCPSVCAGGHLPSWEARWRREPGGARMRRPQYNPLGQNDPEGWVGPSDHGARARDTGRPSRAHGKALAHAAVQAGAAPYPRAPPMPGGSPAQPRGQRRWTAVAPRVATTVSTAKTTPAAQTP